MENQNIVRLPVSKHGAVVNILPRPCVSRKTDETRTPRVIFTVARSNINRLPKPHTVRPRVTTGVSTRFHVQTGSSVVSTAKAAEPNRGMDDRRTIEFFSIDQCSSETSRGVRKTISNT